VAVIDAVYVDVEIVTTSTSSLQLTDAGYCAGLSTGLLPGPMPRVHTALAAARGSNAISAGLYKAFGSPGRSRASSTNRFILAMPPADAIADARGVNPAFGGIVVVT